MQIVSMSTNATLRGHLTQSVECSIQELISHSCLETLRSRARKYVCVTVSRCQHLQAVCNIGYNDAEDYAYTGLGGCRDWRGHHDNGIVRIVTLKKRCRALYSWKNRANILESYINSVKILWLYIHIASSGIAYTQLVNVNFCVFARHSQQTR